MTAIASLLLVLLLSFLVTRLATVMFTLTGLSRDLAQLQAVSAFTGAGFTTRESEQIVSHPFRRRLLIVLMVLGNAGVVTAVSSLILSFTDVERTRDTLLRFAVLGAGLLVLLTLVLSKRIERWLSGALRWFLTRLGRVEARDYAALLKLTGSYSVGEYFVERGDWVADRCLDDLELFQEGITVLGIHRADDFLGVPRGETRIQAGDRLVLYGREQDLDELESRREGISGDAAHAAGVSKQSKEREAQRAREGKSSDTDGA